MPMTREQARELCTKPELELVEASFWPDIQALSPARLRSKMGRARRLQDKYRQLARTQHRNLKSGAGGRSRAGRNVRTERKARLFEETRVRFEKRLARLEEAEQGSTR